MSDIVINIIKDSMIRRQIEYIDEKIQDELYIVKIHCNIKHSHHMDSYYTYEEKYQLKKEIFRENQRIWKSLSII